MSDITDDLTIVSELATATPIPENQSSSELLNCSVCQQPGRRTIPLPTCGHPICHRCRQLALEPTIQCGECGKVSAIPVVGDDESLASSSGSGSDWSHEHADTKKSNTLLWISVAAGVSVAFATWAIAAYLARGRRKGAHRNVLEGKARSWPFRIHTSPTVSMPTISYSTFAYHTRGRAVIAALVAYSRFARLS